VGGKLPVQLDGVSVTIDGKAAYVYYVSPNQIDVIAPADSTTGTVTGYTRPFSQYIERPP